MKTQDASSLLNRFVFLFWSTFWPMKSLHGVRAAWLKPYLVVAALTTGFGASTGNAQAVYDATAAYQSGWTSQTNPNGAWTYGYSANATGAVTPYSSTEYGGYVAGETQEFWITPSLDPNHLYGPSVSLNNGPAFNQGNQAGYVDYPANQLVIVPAGQYYSDVVFTVPATGIYLLDSSFSGDQVGVGTVAGVAVDGTSLFSSTVTSEGQDVPFDANLSLSAGSEVVFSVGVDGGFQNTGFSATFTEVVPEPTCLGVLGMAVRFLLGRRARLRR